VRRDWGKRKRGVWKVRTTFEVQEEEFLKILRPGEGINFYLLTRMVEKGEVRCGSVIGIQQGDGMKKTHPE